MCWSFNFFLIICGLFVSICWIYIVSVIFQNTMATKGKHTSSPSFKFHIWFTFIQEVVIRVDPFNNGSCRNPDSKQKNDLYKVKYGSFYSREVRVSKFKGQKIISHFFLVFDNAINETSSHYVRANVLRMNVYFTLPFFSIGHFSIWNKETTSK